MASPLPPSNPLPLFFIVLQSLSKICHLVIMSPGSFVNYTGFPYPLAKISKSVSSCTESIQTHLLLMFPHLLHLVHLSNSDKLCDLHLKLILLSHNQLENLETVSLH